MSLYWIRSLRLIEIVLIFTFVESCSPQQKSTGVPLRGRPYEMIERKLTFSSFLGGKGEDQGRGITADSNGNFYAVGGTASPNFPIRNGTAINTQTPSDPSCQENMDAYVTKFSPTGQLLWSTALGASNYDRAYEVVTDLGGNVYVSGRGGLGFPVTPGAFQTTFIGGVSDNYGRDDAWIAKLSPDGKVLWASFVGASSNARSLAVDSNGDVYVGTVYDPTLPSPAWYSGAAYAHAYQKTPNPAGDQGVAKISSDGTTVLWATWLYGNTNGTTGVGTIRLDPSGNIYILGNTTSTNLPTTSGAAQKNYGGGPEDLYLAKLSPDGSAVLYATYFGGNGDEYNNTHNMNVDVNGNVFVATHTTSTNLPTTPGAFQLRASPTTQGTIQVAKFSPTGGLLACTYLGGATFEDVDGVSVDERGDVYLSGYTTSPDFPVTAHAYQTIKPAGPEAIFVELASDLTRLVYSTFIGDSGNELARGNFVDSHGTYYMIGQTGAAGWPAVNALQSVYNGGVIDTVIAVFSRFAPVIR